MANLSTKGLFKYNLIAVIQVSFFRYRDDIDYICSFWKFADATGYCFAIFGFLVATTIAYFQITEICPLQRPIITGPAFEAEEYKLVLPGTVGSLQSFLEGYFEQVAIRYHLDCCIRLYHDTNVETNPE